MPQTGHPDWLRIPVGINNIFVNKNLTMNASGTILGTFYVNDYPYLAVTLENFDTVTYNWLEFRWDTVNNPTLWSSRDDIAVGPTNTGTVTIPVKGSWVQVVAFSDVAPTGISSVLIYGTNSQITPDMSRERGDLLISDSSNPGANTNYTLDATAMYAGPCLFSIHSDQGNSASADVRFYSTNSKLHATYMNIGIKKNDSVIPTVLYIPPRHLRIVVFNLGAAQNIVTRVTPAPLYGS